MNRALRASSAGLLCLALALPGCGPKERKRPKPQPPNPYLMEQRLDALESQVSFIRQELGRISQTERSRDDVERRLEVLENRLEIMAEQSVSSTVRDNPLEALPRVSDDPLSVAERKPPPESPSPEDPPPSSAKPLSIRERTPEELFRLGLRHYEAGELALAVEKLTLYLERGRDRSRADEALYLIGRAELARGRPLPAAESFRRVALLYPTSPRRPEALFYGGQAFRRLNDKIQALKLWKELEETYPANPLAAQAREAIARMARER